MKLFLRLEANRRDYYKRGNQKINTRSTERGEEFGQNIGRKIYFHSGRQDKVILSYNIIIEWQKYLEYFIFKYIERIRIINKIIFITNRYKLIAVKKLMKEKESKIFRLKK